MNKLITQISSLVVVVGLGTLWAFNVIDGLQFTTMSTAIVAAIIALNQKFEKEVVKKQLTTAIDRIANYYDMNSELESKLSLVKAENKIVNDRLEILKTKTYEVIDSGKLATPKPKKIKKPKTE